MTIVTSADFQKNFGKYKREALDAPVRITIHGKETLVLVSKAHFDQLSPAYGLPGPSPANHAEALPTGAAISRQSSDIRPAPGSRVASRLDDDDLSDEKIARLQAMLNSPQGVSFSEKPRA